jgi:hypothetical protein
MRGEQTLKFKNMATGSSRQETDFTDAPDAPDAPEFQGEVKRRF